MQTKLSRRTTAVLAGVAGGLLIIAAVAVVILNSQPRSGPSGNSAGGTNQPQPTPTTSAICTNATIAVTSAGELRHALRQAPPGAVIRLAPGSYVGTFTASVSGTQAKPITLCGQRASVLDAGDITKGYVLHLDNVSHWVLDGFTVQNGQKGVVADGTSDTTIENLDVHTIGDEGIHLRAGSTNNTVTGNTVHDTGLYKPKYGEGIYIGTAESNWCDISNCEPDRSDHNTVTRNRIYGTTAECVDIKEGTTGGVLSDNTFDGASITAADSWVDVKGNDWRVINNTGTHSPADGFQTHQILDGWGNNNVFAGNTAAVDGPGYGYHLTPALANRLLCSNTASGARNGLANIPCVPPDK